MGYRRAGIGRGMMGRDTRMRARALAEGTLRRLVRHILSEAPPPDEPRVEPDEAMGQYVMPRSRTSSAYDDVPEADTPLESEFEEALYSHYKRNESGRMANVWDEIWDLAERGLYPELLVTPDRTAWRMLGGVSPDALALMLGTEVGDVTGQPDVAQASKGTVTYSKRGAMGSPDPAGISSWTLEPDGIDPVDFLIAPRSGGRGACSVLVAAPTSGGDFLMNPYGFSRDFKLGKEYSAEAEVISRGPVSGARVAWIYHTPRSEPWKADFKYAQRTLTQALADAVVAWDEGGSERGRLVAFEAWAAFMASIQSALEGPIGVEGAQDALDRHLRDEARAAANPARFAELLKAGPDRGRPEGWAQFDTLKDLSSEVTSTASGVIHRNLKYRAGEGMKAPEIFGALRGALRSSSAGT
jgi:hypothetical protein